VSLVHRSATQQHPPHPGLCAARCTRPCPPPPPPPRSHPGFFFVSVAAARVWLVSLCGLCGLCGLCVCVCGRCSEAQREREADLARGAAIGTITKAAVILGPAAPVVLLGAGVKRLLHHDWAAQQAKYDAANGEAARKGHVDKLAWNSVTSTLGVSKADADNIGRAWCTFRDALNPFKW
jgi:hypothetical protein